MTDSEMNNLVDKEGQGASLIPTPNPDLKSLDRLIGTWKQTGGVEGVITYEWLEGKFFLIQRVDLEQYGQQIKGIEVIGHLQPFGEESSRDIKSRFYSLMDGMTLDYTYELIGNTLMIWAGDRGSPVYFEGKFSEDGNTLTGDWIYPGGGGYQAIATKVE